MLVLHRQAVWMTMLAISQIRSIVLTVPIHMHIYMDIHIDILMHTHMHIHVHSVSQSLERGTNTCKPPS